MPFDYMMSELDTNKFDFPIEMKPIYTMGSDGNVIELPKSHGQLAVNPRDNSVYKVHGGRYVPTNHKLVMDQVNEGLDKLGFNLETVQVTDTIARNRIADGARVRRDIVFPNLVIQPAVGDIMNFKMSIFASYDGSWAHQITFSALRLWCLNGCVTPRTMMRAYERHTRKISMEKHINRISESLELFHKDEQLFKRMIERELAPAKTFELINAFASDRNRVVDEKLRDDLQLRYATYHSLGHSLYRAYNTFTDWSTHFEMKRGGLDHNVRFAREQKVAAFLRTPLWTSLM